MLAMLKSYHPFLCAVDAVKVNQEAPAPAQQPGGGGPQGETDIAVASPTHHLQTQQNRQWNQVRIIISYTTQDAVYVSTRLNTLLTPHSVNIRVSFCARFLSYK